MKTFFSILISLIFTAIPVYADDLQDGKEAFLNGARGNIRDYEKAFRLLKPYADEGNAKAQNIIGQLYQYGLGVKQDLPKAVILHKLSAEQGDKYSQYSLGQLYQNGQGVKQDYIESARMYKLSAEQGHRISQYHLGQIYQNGQGVKQDYLKAIKWILQASKNGVPEAQLLRRQNHYHKWIELRAEQGDIDAQIFLGANYYMGLNVTQDYSKAARWYLRAAEQGSDVAQNIIGAMNEKGKGVSKNYVEAIKWYTISEQSGNHYGSIYKEHIKKRMDSAQIAKAWKLAKKWLDAHGK